MDEITLLRNLDDDLAGPDPAVKAAARATLDRHIASSTEHADAGSNRSHGQEARAPRWPRLALPSAAAAAALLLVGALTLSLLGVPGGGSSTAYAATPPALMPLDVPATPAQPVLLSLAAAAEAQPSQPAGRYNHLKTNSWYLHTAVSNGQGRSEVIPWIAESWIAQDGSGVTIEARGEPLPAAAPGDDGDRPANQALPADSGEVTRYQPGERHLFPTESLPRDPAALRDTLVTDNSGLPDHAQLFVALTDRLVQQWVEPELVAAFYRALAEEPAMRSFGVVTDRAGRDGVAVGFDSDHSGLPTRYLLIVDPDTGTPLGYEQILTTDAGKLNVQVPAVIGYTSFLAGGPVQTTDETGPPIP